MSLGDFRSYFTCVTICYYGEYIRLNDPVWSGPIPAHGLVVEPSVECNTKQHDVVVCVYENQEKFEERRNADKGKDNKDDKKGLKNEMITNDKKLEKKDGINKYKGFSTTNAISGGPAHYGFFDHSERSAQRWRRDGPDSRHQRTQKGTPHAMSSTDCPLYLMPPRDENVQDGASPAAGVAIFVRKQAHANGLTVTIRPGIPTVPRRGMAKS